MVKFFERLSAVLLIVLFVPQMFGVLFGYVGNGNGAIHKPGTMYWVAFWLCVAQSIFGWWLMYKVFWS